MDKAIWTAIGITLGFIGAVIAVLILIIGLTLIRKKWPDMWN